MASRSAFTAKHWRANSRCADSVRTEEGTALLGTIAPLFGVLGGASFSGTIGERPTSITELCGAPLGLLVPGSLGRMRLATSRPNSDGSLVGFFAVSERNLF